MRSSSWSRALGLLLIVAAAWFLGLAIATNWAALRAFDWRIDPLLLSLSLVAHLAVLAWGVVVWGRVLRHFDGPRVPQRQLFRIWFASSLARYIPGKIFQFVAAAQLGRAAGFAATTLVASLLVHTGMAVLAATLLAAWTLAPQLLGGFPPLAVGLAASLIAVLLVRPVPLSRLLDVVSRLTRREPIRWRAGWGDGLVLLLLSVLSWVFYGVAYFLFIAALTPVPLQLFPLLAGVNALAFVAGYLAVVTPGGLGVREAAMAGLLTPLLPLGIAAILAIAARLWTIAAELLGAAVALALVRGGRVLPPSSSEPATRVD